MFKVLQALFAAALAALSLALPAFAQEGPELQLRISKNFGYAAGGEMQGTFSLRATGPDTLERVVFTLDGEPMGEVGEAPFNFSFNTDNHAMGEHTLAATGYTRDGRTLQSNEIRREFVTAEQGWQSGLRILGPILALVLAVTLITTFLPLIGGKKRLDTPPGEERQYGFAGGAICPRCQRPFPLRVLSINVSPFHRLDRCPYCGKWSVLRPRPLQELRAAERAELTRQKAEIPAPEESEEEKLLKELERSRYDDV